MLVVAAFKLGHPMLFIVLVKPDNRALHDVDAGFRLPVRDGRTTRLRARRPRRVRLQTVR